MGHESNLLSRKGEADCKHCIRAADKYFTNRIGTHVDPNHNI